MKKSQLQPRVPSIRSKTHRDEIIAILAGRVLSARDISAEAGLSEKDVYDHLEHIRLSLGNRKGKLVVEPAECRKCGFVFRKRHRLRKPGKCPVCRGESISEPLFSLE